MLRVVVADIEVAKVLSVLRRDDTFVSTCPRSLCKTIESANAFSTQGPHAFSSQVGQDSMRVEHVRHGVERVCTYSAVRAGKKRTSYGNISCA